MEEVHFTTSKLMCAYLSLIIFKVNNTGTEYVKVWDFKPQEMDFDIFREL